jgi:hypothetical protein
VRRRPGWPTAASSVLSRSFSLVSTTWPAMYADGLAHNKAEISTLESDASRAGTKRSSIIPQPGNDLGLVRIRLPDGSLRRLPTMERQADAQELGPAGSGKCLHFYFDFRDANFRSIHLRVPIWAPVRLQFHCGGYSWLACKLTADCIDCNIADNAFIRIDDWALYFCSAQ